MGPKVGGSSVRRYDLRPAGRDQTDVTLTYDWYAVPPPTREHIRFPPFEATHLDNSLRHLAELARGRLSL
jgi:hypothetical protein